MSHFTSIKTEIYDLEILKQTLSGLKLEFKENGGILGFGREVEIVDVAVKVDGRFRLGFKSNNDKKGYEVSGLKEFLRQGEARTALNRILQEYAYRKILAETRKRGFALVQEERVKPGTIKLVLRKVA